MIDTISGSSTARRYGETSDPGFMTVAVAASVTAIGIAAVYWLSRVGFDNPFGPVLRSIALSLFAINAPLCESLLLRRKTKRLSWPTSYSFLWLSNLLLLGILGRAVTLTGLNPFPLVAALGVATFLFVLVRWLAAGSLWRSLAVIAGSSLFAAWTAGVVWGRIYKSPLFLEMLSLDGVVHHDSIHLAALGNMLQAYGVASVGLDGLAQMTYHWGTPWLFAQLSNMLNVGVIEFYQLTYPVMMIPFFFGGVLALAVEIRSVAPEIAESPGRRGQTLAFWGILLAASIGVIPVTAMDALGVWTSNLVISESYAVAVPAGLLLLAVAVVFWREGGGETLNAGRLDRNTAVFLVVVLGPGIMILGYLKISLMILGFLLVIYFGLRLRLYRRPAFLLYGLLLTTLVAYAYRQVSLPQHREGISPLDFLHGFVPVAWWQLFPLVHLFWPLLYTVLRLRQERLQTVGDAIRAARDGRLFDVEAVVVVALAGIAPGLVFHINGGSAFYFSDVQRWLAVGFILARAPSLFGVGENKVTVASRISLRHVGLALVAVPLGITLVANALYWPRRMLRANLETRAALYTLAGRGAPPVRIRSLAALAEESTLRAGLSAGRNTPVVEGLLQLGQASVEERRRTALFIPQTERRYWDILARQGACTFDPHVAPALAGMAMIDGMPAAECELTPYYGVGTYTPRRRAQLPADTLPGTLCAKARAWGLSRVLSIHFDERGRMSSTPHQCIG